MLSQIALSALLVSFPVLSSAQPIILSSRSMSDANINNDDNDVDNNHRNTVSNNSGATTTNHTTTTTGSDHLSHGGIAALVIVLVVGGVLLIALSYWYIKLHKQRKAAAAAAVAEAQAVETSNAAALPTPPQYDLYSLGLPEYKAREEGVSSPPYAQVTQPEKAHVPCGDDEKALSP